MRKIPAIMTVALATVAIPLAAPASADPMAPDQLVSGMYNLHFPDGSLEDQTFKATSCGIGCVQVNFSNTSGQAQFYADRWHASFPPNPAAWRCPDGSVHRGFDEWTWDPATGVGSRVVVRTEAACGYTDHSSVPIAHRFALTKLSGQSAQPGSLAPAIA
ncbi:hypothetical protein H7K33_15260 [Mycobacterium paraense]|uniref:hypothetical protein n=1 Tax=Mycobacterium paraense TaxID=767916 RepID=UPI000A167F9B|nr:hypothetical protein [Mycobacterium paraense]MCV7443595.1 hypothetical protein [Mycobacterium paraense]ORW47365.1 hypothetical protein AWB89_09515 [Mycobacterium paraense]